MPLQAHPLVLDKTEYFILVIGVISIDWFKSYLSGRHQVVTFDSITSCPGLVTCGVSHESILGPVFFLCYVNIEMFKI